MRQEVSSLNVLVIYEFLDFCMFGKLEEVLYFLALLSLINLALKIPIPASLFPPKFHILSVLYSTNIAQ